MTKKPATTDHLRTYLDERGIDGAPTVPGWYVAGIIGRGVGVVHAAESHDGEVIHIATLMARPSTAVRMVGGEAVIVGYERSSAGGCGVNEITRHSPLPDFIAMQTGCERMPHEDRTD